MAQYDVDLREYGRIISKRKWWIIGMALLVGVCSYAFAKFKEPSPLYEATAAIKINRSSNMGEMLTGGYWRHTDNMQTHAYIIKSFPVLVIAAKSLDWLDRDLSIEAIQNNKTHLEQVQRLKSMVSAEHQERTNIIDIQATSGDPDKAARVANALANAYQGYNIEDKNKKTFETKLFIEEELRKTSQNLAAAEQDLQNYKESAGLISLDTQTQTSLGKLNAVETEYERTRLKREEIDSQLQMLGGSRIGMARQLQASLFAASPDSPLFTLKTKLSDLLLQRQNLLINYTAKHPQVRAVDDQIGALILETKKELQ
jgi:uncharacterized protein involved in exopolysaccharide biosynthesis